MTATIPHTPARGSEAGPGNRRRLGGVRRIMKAPIVLAVLLVLGSCRFPGATTAPTVPVAGRAVAGPVCPVESVSPDPSCAPRPVAGAELVVRDADGRIVQTLRTDDDGRFATTLPPGSYRIEPQRVEGILGTAPAVDIEVREDSPLEDVVIVYDTGIR
jgi:hypothetical protein